MERDSGITCMLHYCMLLTKLWSDSRVCLFLTLTVSLPPPSSTHTNNWRSYSVSCTSDMVVLSAGLTESALSPILAFFPGWVQCCPCPALVCSRRHHNKNKPWNSRPLHAIRSSGLCGTNNRAFRYSQNKKARRPGMAFNARGGNDFNAAVFTEATSGRIPSQTGGWG